MGIDSESDVSANLQIGPTTLGMVRLYIEAEGAEIPLDFEPDEALEIAEEIRAAAERARQMAAQKPEKRVKTGQPGAGQGSPKQTPPPSTTARSRSSKR